MLLEGKIINVENGNLKYPYNIEFLEGRFDFVSENEIVHRSKTYSDGLTEAWELARKVYCTMSSSQLKEIFDIEGGYGSEVYGKMLKEITPQEALAKIEAYEKLQQIEVGDEIAVVGNAIKGYVIEKSQECEDCYVVLITNYKDLHTAIYNKTVIKKTGQHIDISSILEQIRGNE